MRRANAPRAPLRWPMAAFRLSALKARIDTLDLKVPPELQIGMYGDVTELLRRLGLWFLMNIPASADLGETVARYRGGVDALRGTFSTLVSDYEAQDTEEPHRRAHRSRRARSIWPRMLRCCRSSAPRRKSSSSPMPATLDIDLVAGAYFAVGETVGLDRLRGLATRIAASEHWDRLAIRRIVDDLFAGQRALTTDALAGIKDGKSSRADGAAAVASWAERNADALSRTRAFLEELERTGDLSIAKLTLANSQVHALAGR